jgi:flagellar basal-body rod protein FlgB
MSDMSLMALAARKAEWLAARQAIVSQNIANANTPGYRARELAGFDAALTDARLEMAATNLRHISSVQDGLPAFATVMQGGDAGVTGNDVSLEREMSKLGETSSQYALTSNLIKSQHRLAMMSLKG